MHCKEIMTTKMSRSKISSGTLLWLLVTGIITTVSSASVSSDSNCDEHENGDVWTEYNEEYGTCNGWRCDDGTAVGLPCPTPPTEEDGCKSVPGNSTAQYPQCCETTECTSRCFSNALSTFYKPQDIWQENGEWKSCVLDEDEVANIIEIPPPNDTDKPASRDGDCAEHKNGDKWTEEGCVGWQCDNGTAVGLPCAPFVITEESGCRRVPGNPTAQYPQCCETAECPPGCFSTVLSAFFQRDDIWQENGVWKACVVNRDDNVASIIDIMPPNDTNDPVFEPSETYFDPVFLRLYYNPQEIVHMISNELLQIFIDTEQQIRENGRKTSNRVEKTLKITLHSNSEGDLIVTMTNE